MAIRKSIVRTEEVFRGPGDKHEMGAQWPVGVHLHFRFVSATQINILFPHKTYSISARYSRVFVSQRQIPYFIELSETNVE
jgi:hypothetical protein